MNSVNARNISKTPRQDCAATAYRTVLCHSYLRQWRRAVGAPVFECDPLAGDGVPPDDEVAAEEREAVRFPGVEVADRQQRPPPPRPRKGRRAARVRRIERLVLVVSPSAYRCCGLANLARA